MVTCPLPSRLSSFHLLVTTTKTKMFNLREITISPSRGINFWGFCSTKCSYTFHSRQLPWLWNYDCEQVVGVLCGLWSVPVSTSLSYLHFHFLVPIPPLGECFNCIHPYWYLAQSTASLPFHSEKILSHSGKQGGTEALWGLYPILVADGKKMIRTIISEVFPHSSTHSK